MNARAPGAPALLAAALVLAAALPAAPLPTASAAEAAETHHVHIQSFAFDPGALAAATGDTVVFHNHDTARHTASATDGSWDTGAINPGDSAAILVRVPGEWEYLCAFHPSMRGSLTATGDPLQAPTVAITAPGDGDAVAGVVTIAGNASADPRAGGVERVEVRVNDGPWAAADGAESWTLQWDTTLLANGAATIRARAFDGGAHSQEALVTVEVANPPAIDLRIAPGDIRATHHHTAATVQVTVHNQGNAPAGAFTVHLAYAHGDGERPIGTQGLPGLHAKASATLTYRWDTLGKVGDFQLVAHADREGAVDDADPSNNAASRTASVLVAGAPGTDLLDPL